MTEAIAVPAAGIEPAAETEKTKKNRVTTLVTAATLGSVSVIGGIAEYKGWVSGWPMPAHSFKHLAPGYSAAWAASNAVSRHKNAAALTAAGATDALLEGSQSWLLSQSHDPLLAVEVNNPHRGEGNMENAVDAAICMAGALIFIAQNNGYFDKARQRFGELRVKLRRGGARTPVFTPVD